jgi:hypothetical protein
MYAIFAIAFLVFVWPGIEKFRSSKGQTAQPKEKKEPEIRAETKLLGYHPEPDVNELFSGKKPKPEPVTAGGPADEPVRPTPIPDPPAPAAPKAPELNQGASQQEKSASSPNAAGKVDTNTAHPTRHVVDSKRGVSFGILAAALILAYFYGPPIVLDTFNKVGMQSWWSAFWISIAVVGTVWFILNSFYRDFGEMPPEDMTTDEAKDEAARNNAQADVIDSRLKLSEKQKDYRNRPTTRK